MRLQTRACEGDAPMRLGTADRMAIRWRGRLMAAKVAKRPYPSPEGPLAGEHNPWSTYLQLTSGAIEKALTWRGSSRVPVREAGTWSDPNAQYMVGAPETAETVS